MKIVHVCGGSFYKEGMGYQENILPQMHRKQGIDTYVVAMAEKQLENGKYKYITNDYVNAYGIKVRIIKYKKYGNIRLLNEISKIFKIFDGLKAIIEDIGPDIIFIHGGQFGSLYEIREYVRENPHVKLFIDQHMDYYNEPKNSLLMHIVNKVYGYEMRKIAGYVNRFWGVTPWRCEYLRDVYKLPKDKVDLLVMGGEDEKINFEQKKEISRRLRAELNIDENDFVIISGGRIDRTKNVHILMDAVSELNNPHIKLIVFGNTNVEMTAEIDEKSKHSSIRYIGWIQSDKAYDYFLASDLAIFPGTHSVLWEQACACGIPCVFNDWKGMRHVDVGGNCSFVDGNSKEQLIKEIDYIVNNPDKYAIMKSVAENTGVKVFSYRDIAKRAIAISKGES